MAEPKKLDDKQTQDAEVGSSDNLAGYKVKEFSDYLGEDLKDKYSSKHSEDNNHLSTNAQILVPEPNKESILNAKMFITLAIFIFCGVLIIAYINHKDSKNMSTNPGQIKSPAGQNSSSTSTKNPLTDGGSIDSQLQYCSNPVNAQNNC